MKSLCKGSYSEPQIYNFTTLPLTENINEEVHTPGPTICTVTQLTLNLTAEGSKLGPKCVIKRPTSELPVRASNKYDFFISIFYVNGAITPQY